MNNDPALIQDISTFCAKRAANIDKTVTPKLKEQVQLFQANYRAFYELLLQKGAVKADPYKHERHLSDIRVPKEPPQSEPDLEDQLPILLSEYDNILDFLVSYTALDIQNMSLRKIKILMGIIKYVEWAKVNPNSTHLLSRMMGVMTEKVRGNDDLATQTVNSMLSQMDNLIREILKSLKAIADFKREEYKIVILQTIIATVPALQAPLGKDEFLKAIKSNMTKSLPGEAFYPELVQELHSDLHEISPEEFTKKMQDAFRIEEVRKKSEASQSFNLRDILNDGLRNLGTSSRHLDEAVSKLQENREILKSRPKSLMERFKAWIVSLSGPRNHEESIAVELVDMYTSARKVEHVQFLSFCNTVQRKSRYLASLQVRNSATWVKLDAATEEQIYEILERNILELKTFHDMLDALDTYFKSEAPPQERGKLRGVKVELGNVKNSIATTSQKMHEYIARKDEMEQLRKLGIKVD